MVVRCGFVLNKVLYLFNNCELSVNNCIMMAECDEMFHRVNEKAQAVFLRIPEECQKTLDWVIAYRKDIQTKLVQIQTENYNIPILPKTPSRSRVKRAKRHVQTSSDEDHTTLHAEKSTDITDSSISTSGKPKRNASKLAEQKINIQSQQKLNTKMRRPGKDALNDISNNAIILNIKPEKKSKSPSKDPVPEIELQPAAEDVKKENMPPPAFKPKRNRKKIKKEVESSDTENEGGRVTRSKRSAKTSSSTRTASKSRNDSDVIIQETPVPVVVVVDSDTEDNASQNSEVESNIETSKKAESTAGDTDDDLPLKSRKTKKKVKKAETKSKKTQKETAKINEAKDNSVYEDALPLISNNKQLDLPSKTKGNVKNCTSENTNLNITHVIQKDSTKSSLNSTRVITTSTLNETHVITKDNEQILKHKNAVVDCSVVLHKMNETVTLPKSNANQTVVLSPRDNHWKKADVPPPVDNLLTDDDDSIVKVTPEKKPDPPRKGIKTKQMFSPYANSPVRKRVAAFEKLVTNDVDIPNRVTRTKTRNMEKENQAQNSESSAAKIPSKPKYFTPTINNKLPSLIPQSDSKTYKVNKNSTIQIIKSATAIKPSKAEAQLRREEDQKKRLEKEEEAKKKREAIMLAKAEEQRKKREEKQLKAQKAREEMEREKEEKLRQMLQEKEEEQQKKREWQAKKMAEIEERKKAEEQMKMMKIREQEKLRMMEEKRKKQLASKPPPLPTGDCEDSDSSSDNVPRKPKYIKPEWAQSQNLERFLAVQSYIRKCRIETLFQMQATTPDLREIFETVDERLLRRNSSAVWRTPPRYSTLTKF